MYFVTCDIKEAKSTRTNSDLRTLLMKIADSGKECVEIKDYPHSSANSCVCALNGRIRKDRLHHLKVVTKDKRVFVINTLLVKEVK